MKAGCLLSEDTIYRLKTWRIWDESRKPALFVTLMAHIPEEYSSGTLVMRCCRLAEDLGAGGAVLVPLFGLRAWEFAEVKRSEKDPVGPDNDECLLEAAREASHVICA